MYTTSLLLWVNTNRTPHKLHFDDPPVLDVVLWDPQECGPFVVLTVRNTNISVLQCLPITVCTHYCLYWNVRSRVPLRYLFTVVKLKLSLKSLVHSLSSIPGCHTLIGITGPHVKIYVILHIFLDTIRPDDTSHDEVRYGWRMGVSSYLHPSGRTVDENIE